MLQDGGSELMRRTRLRISALAAFGLLLAGGDGACASDLKVVATVKPIHSIVAAVMDGVAAPTLLIDGAASPHTFTLKPSDARALAAARVVFRVSDGVEPFMGKVVKSLPKSVRVVALEKVPGLTLHKIRSGGTFEAHDDGAGGKHDHGHRHGHGKSGAGTDGHIWLDPENATLIATYVADVLGEAYPDAAARFKSNADAFSRDIAALTTELSSRLAPLADRPFIVFHDAYQYFEKRFGLAAAGSVTVSPDLAPSVKRLTALRAKIGRLNAVCVFAEPQFEPRQIATITENTTAKRGVLDPLGASIPAGSGHYAALLRKMAADFAHCLE
jgi:zinc transport system substrate-binding protein